MNDPRYTADLKGIPAEQLPEKMKDALRAVQGALPPGMGVTLFVFDFGTNGGVSYISNAQRGDMVRMIETWLRRIRGMN